MESGQLIQKLWNYCNILRDDGLSYGEYPSVWSILSAAAFHAVNPWASILHAH
ncbi:MAG TPA: hypothetical protein VJ733_01035 [Candidatus Binatia bacterium]|nr:hypothetical protein [Candidatus Binatia bacterium]